jgi:hypothetical protein
MDMKQVPHMGTHLIMDFVGVESLDLNNYDSVYNMMT